MKPRAFEKAAKLPIVSPLFEIENLKATWDEESYDLKLRSTATTKLRRNTVYELRDLSAILVDADGNVVGAREGTWNSTRVFGGIVNWVHDFPKHYRKRAVSAYYVVNCEFEEITPLFRADVAPFSTDDDSRQVVELTNRVSECGDVDLDFNLETIRGELQISVLVSVRDSGFYEFRCDRGLVRFLDAEGNPVTGTSLTFWTQPDAAILVRDATMKLHSRAASHIRKLEYTGRLGVRISNLIGPIQIS